MVKSRLEPLPRFNTIGRAEHDNLMKALKHPLSGYLGGINKAGYWVERLQSEWCDTFKVKHAVACNSATSGLLAACMAAGIGKGSKVWTTGYSMSATAACAKVLGADIVFIDIETTRFSMNMSNFKGTPPKCIIVTNLFGHPAYIGAMRSWCDSNNVIMIEDAAQSPFAMEGGKYAGTVGHIGVWSYNIHKSINAGEGGVVATNDQSLGDRIRAAINHGELGETNQIGLNLRMSELTAAVACAQLAKGPKIIETRRALADELTNMFMDYDWIKPPVEDEGCRHVYYLWAARVLDGKRDEFVKRLNEYGFPIRKGYSPTLNRVFKQLSYCPVAEKMEDEQLICFEVCAYDPNTHHIKRMNEIVKRVAGEMDGH